MCMGSPAIADVGVKVEKVVIEPKDDKGAIPNSKKTMKITLNKAVKAVESTQGLPANSSIIVSLNSLINRLKKANGDKKSINRLERQKFLLLKHTEEATGSGKNWSMKIERFGIGERIDPHGTFGMYKHPYKGGIVRPITIKWTNKDGTTGSDNITLLALAKIVKLKDGTIEDRVISVDLFPQE